ncbi:MAG TPA: hypothetical protein VGI88_03180 [Verrucomicrobiae bacterium]
MSERRSFGIPTDNDVEIDYGTPTRLRDAVADDAPKARRFHRQHFPQHILIVRPIELWEQTSIDEWCLGLPVERTWVLLGKWKTRLPPLIHKPKRDSI